MTGCLKEILTQCLLLLILKKKKMINHWFFCNNFAVVKMKLPVSKLLAQQGL